MRLDALLAAGNHTNAVKSTTYQRQHVQPHEAAHERVHAEAQVGAEEQDAVRHFGRWTIEMQEDPAVL